MEDALAPHIVIAADQINASWAGFASEFILISQMHTHPFPHLGQSGMFQVHVSVRVKNCDRTARGRGEGQIRSTSLFSGPSYFPKCDCEKQYCYGAEKPGMAQAVEKNADNAPDDEREQC